MSYNVFNLVRVYQGKWEVKEKRHLTESEMSRFSGAEVVPSKNQDYGRGISVMFYLKSGGYIYVPTSRDSTLEVGDEVKLTDLQWVVLGRDGDEPILRVE